MTDNQGLVGQFSSITGSSQEEARRILEDNEWDLQDAVSSFYERGSAASAPAASGTGAERKPAWNVRGFGDIQPEKGDDDEGENYFAGGEKSGIVMKGPKKDEKSKNLVKDILDMAAKAGPPPGEDEDMDEEDDNGAGASGRAKPKVQAFAGSGHRLGSEDEPQAPATSASPVSRPAGDPSALGGGSSREKVVRTLTFWKNGFSVEDGPLMSYDDPQNQQLLEAMKSGRAPPSLLNVATGQPVEVRVSHKLEEDYKPPPKIVKPFQGQGHSLGSVMPAMPATTVPGAFPHAGPSGSTGGSQCGSKARPPALEVDSTQPTTSIQVRLADGTRMVAKFNHTHTIGDLRRFIRAARPGDAGFSLTTTFPMKTLTEDSQTLKEAGLLNAVVVQKM